MDRSWLCISIHPCRLQAVCTPKFRAGRCCHSEPGCSIQKESAVCTPILRGRLSSKLLGCDSGFLRKSFRLTWKESSHILYIYILYIIIVIMKDLNVHPTQEHWVSTRPLSTHEGCQPACIIRSSPNSSGVIRQFRIRRRRAGFARTLRA